MKNRVCLRCEKPLDGHPNRKRCETCAAFLRKRPVGRLSALQEIEARALAGTMYQEELATRLGCSRSNLIRWARDAEVSLDFHSYKPEVIRTVCACYERHGRSKTQQMFPHVSVRSIVERNSDKFRPRQTRWTGSELLEAVRMAGLVSPAAQARFFNRPGANEGSIKSLWMKKFGFGEGSINGLVKWHAQHLAESEIEYLNPIGQARDKRPVQFRWLALWVDLEKHLRPNLPEYLIHGITAMADFQRWIWKSEKPRPLILKMMRERELSGSETRS